VYSIPAYALRFAAHCRSRLRLTEPSLADHSRTTAPSRTWIRHALDPAHVRRIAECAAKPARGAA